MSALPLWHVHSRSFSEFVRADNQFEAWDTLRYRPAEDFGLIVMAERDESGDPIPVHTSMLMFRWGRDGDAARFIEVAVANGLPDTTAADRKAAGRA